MTTLHIIRSHNDKQVTYRLLENLGQLISELSKIYGEGTLTYESQTFATFVPHAWEFQIDVQIISIETPFALIPAECLDNTLRAQLITLWEAWLDDNPQDGVCEGLSALQAQLDAYAMAT